MPSTAISQIFMEWTAGSQPVPCRASVWSCSATEGAGLLPVTGPGGSMDVDRPLSPVAQTPAAPGHRDVPLDRCPAQLEALGDLCVGQPLGDEFRHGLLPGGQRSVEGRLLILRR